MLLAVAYVHTHRGAPEAERVHDQLVQRVRTARSAAAGVAARVSQAEQSLARRQSGALPSGGALAQGLDRDRFGAGETAVHGPGLAVTLTEPAPPSKTSAAPGQAAGAPILTDQDLRSVVNELWGDGAEAIAVNGIRLTPTSAIRFAGEAMLVDFKPIDSPYRIKAVGDPDRLATRFAQSAAASRLQTLEGAVGIGFDFRNESDLHLPAGTAVTPRYARPAPTASPSR